MISLHEEKHISLLHKIKGVLCMNNKTRKIIFGMLCVLIFLLIPTFQLQAQKQVAPDRYRIDFTDKNHSIYTTDSPQFFLSERALQRRIRQGIAIMQADLPVSV